MQDMVFRLVSFFHLTNNHWTWVRISYTPEMPLASGHGGLYHTRNLGVQLTLLQPGPLRGSDYAHQITANPGASLHTMVVTRNNPVTKHILVDLFKDLRVCRGPSVEVLDSFKEKL